MRYILKEELLKSGVTVNFWVVGTIDLIDSTSNSISGTMSAYLDKSGFLAGITPLATKGFYLEGANNPMVKPIPDNATTIGDAFIKGLYLDIIQLPEWAGAEFIEEAVSEIKPTKWNIRL